MRIWVVGRRGDPPGLPLGGANRPISQWEQVALSLMPAAREPVRRHNLPDGDLSEREWPDADDEDDDDKEQADQDGGEPSSFMQRRPPLQGGSSSSADVVPPGCEAMAMVRRTLRRLIATLAATEAAALQQQVETTLLLFDPQEPTEDGGGHRTSKRPRYTNGFGEVIRQLRLLGGRPTHDLTDEELATDMSVAKAYVDTGLAELQRRLGDQGGLQVEEAYGGGATAAKALSAATSKAMGGDRAWLTQSWLLTVMSLLQEGEALLEEQNHLPDVVHAADVVALQEGAEEQLGGLPAAERVRHLCHQLSDLLPFVEGSRATEARGLLGALLEWVQTNMGTTVAVDSQGGPIPNHSCHRTTPSQAQTTALDDRTAAQQGNSTQEGDGPDVLPLPSYWQPRGNMTGLEVPRKGVTERGDKWGALGAARLPLRPRTVGRARQGRGGGSAVPSRGGVPQTNGAPPPPEPRGGAQT